MRNVTCVNGHGVSIGSVRHGIVTNVTFEDVVMWDSENGARLKTYPDHSGHISGITYRNFTLHRVGTGLLIDGKYCPRSQKPYPCPPGHVAVKISDVVFEGFRGSVGDAGRFDCSPLAPCTGITLRNINLDTLTKFSCSNITGPRPVNVAPPSCIANYSHENSTTPVKGQETPRGMRLRVDVATGALMANGTSFRARGINWGKRKVAKGLGFLVVLTVWVAFWFGSRLSINVSA